MPFDMTGFRPAAVTTGLAPRIHTYVTTDAAADVDTTGYFNPVRDLLRVGDLIYRVTVTGVGALSTAGFHVVRQVTPNADVTDTTALTVTNTD